jgi:hypothetical protein
MRSAYVEWFACAASSFAVATLAPAARADEKSDCVTSFEAAQTLRKESKLIASREQLLRCVQQTCPSVVRDYCRSWLEEVDRALPTIVIVARDGEGRDVSHVRMTLDGRPLAQTAMGAAVPIDPGEHALRFEHDASPPVEQKLVAREGEKRREVTVTFQTTPRAGPSGSGEALRDRVMPTAPSRGGPPTLAFVMVGVGVVALGGFAYFGLQALSDAHRLRQTCAPYCEQADIDAVKTKNLLSGVSLGVGIVTVGIGTWLFLKPRGGGGPAAGAMAGPLPGGGWASYNARF